MERRSFVSTLLALLLVAGLAAQSAGRPPRPDDENGLSANESATLWSRDDDSDYISNEAYRESYGESRSAVAQVANATDLTFTGPPETAATWTRNDHREFDAGDADTSVYPPHANRTNGTFIEDAHATIFAVTPATVAHKTPTSTRTYAAPNGTLRGVVDYRVTLPSTDGSTITGDEFRVVRHRIEEVRMLRNGVVVGRTNGSHRPVVPYRLLDGSATLRLEADITVTIAATTPAAGARLRALVNDSGATRSRTQSRMAVTETVTATDRLSVETYDPSVLVTTARYPDGDRGVAAYYTQPWRGLQLTENGSQRVRGVWRFYTARDPRWDRLVHASANGTERVDSPVLPVAIHAYPSRLGPRTEPVGRSPTLLDVWGRERPSPAPALPETVHVEVVTERYRVSDGLAVRTDAPLGAELTVTGIVRGVNASISRTGPSREIRRSRLDVTVLSEDDEGMRVLVELTDAETGEPISLSDETPRYAPITGGRTGYIEVGPYRVRTNRSGMATVRITDAGVYTARYVPGSWLTQAPAYTGAKATVRWHPLATVGGWLDLITRGLLWFLPFALAVYAGRRLGGIVSTGGGRR